MRNISIKVDTVKFQEEIKRSGDGRVPPISAADVKDLISTAFILIGNRTSGMGGGMASTGYIIQNGKATHSVGVSSADLQQGFVRFH